MIREAVGVDDAFIELNRGLGVTGFILILKVYVKKAKSLRVAFIPLKLIQQRPCCVAFHIHPISNGYRNQKETTVILILTRLFEQYVVFQWQKTFWFIELNYMPFSISLM